MRGWSGAHDVLEVELAGGRVTFGWVYKTSGGKDIAGTAVINDTNTARFALVGGTVVFFPDDTKLITSAVDDTTREWLLVAVTVRQAKAGWAIADTEVWDDEGRFLAYGAQAMYINGLAGEPPTVDASQR